ncbi:YkvA family protein [Hymenobacter aerilatus]|uniref:YkvA family protein n=1 Tax=Hymenobacter aerilatus TaxID=2932251 RepID=A0A8T9SYZ7_9BACT|nr:YkvA family protein [Hymenobacter aerilatus]UOR06621.1 YkvA family protein [Hymenobacter aerilatus]
MATLAEKGFNIAKNAVFSAFIGRATRMLGKPFLVATALHDVAQKLDDQDSKKGPIQQVIDVGRLLIRLVTAFINGSYRELSKTTAISGLAVLLYVLSPIDLVPDALPVLGFLDDAALIAWFMERFRQELEHFKSWEETSAKVAEDAHEPARPNKELPAVAELGHS